jgi:aspartate-semialdehyde dehydrogenase
MAGKSVRAVIVGATSVLAKELAEQLTESTAAMWDLTLLDSGADGQVTAAGDEALVVMPVDAAGFAGADVVFFAGNAGVTRKHWRDALTAGASVVDLSGALEQEDGVLLLAPGVSDARADLKTVAAMPVEPVVLMLALVHKRMAALGDVKMAATVMQPASVLGAEGMDELHQQTVGLLSFQNLNKDVYDAQVAFTMRDKFGEEAKTPLDVIAATVRRQLVKVMGEDAAWSLELLQAPVFHGVTASVWVEVAAEADALIAALSGDGLRLIDGDGEDETSNLAATGQDDVFVRVRASEGKMSGFWLWMAADNLRIAARSAIACAGELLAVRPGATLQ